MSSYAQRFALTNERSVVGRVVFLDRGQTGVVTEVADTSPDWAYLTDVYNEKDKVPPKIVTVAFGMKARKIKTYPCVWLGDYDMHLAYQAELLRRMVDRRTRLPGALPYEVLS